jgi:ElaB/YqjD/DUF883 family membrane-anchored ribosome-binding protein
MSDIIDEEPTGTERAGGTVNEAKDRIRHASRTVQEKMDEARGPAADRIGKAASALHGKADRLPGGKTVADLAHGAADWMQNAADYVRGRDVEAMAADFGNAVRKNPGRSLLAAIAAGFLIGRAFRRRSWKD